MGKSKKGLKDNHGRLIVFLSQFLKLSYFKLLINPLMPEIHKL